MHQRLPLRLAAALQRPRWTGHLNLSSWWSGYAVSLASIAAVSLLIGVVRARAEVASLPMLYLVPVLALSVAFGRGPAVTAALAAFLVHNWFFIEPRYTLVVSDPAEWLALILFLLVAVVCSELASGARRRAQEAEQREAEMQALYQLGEIIAAPDAGSGWLNAAADWLTVVLEVEAAVVSVAGWEVHTRREGCAGQPDALAFLQRPHGDGQGGERVLRRRTGSPDPRSRLRWVRVRRGPRDRTAVASGWEVRAAPLVAAGQQIGVLRLAWAISAPPFTPQQDRLLAAAAAQIAHAAERARLQAIAAEAAVLRRTGELKTALLDSVSHDLRTPLAGIKAAAGSLRQTDVPWTDGERAGFAAAIEQEADRMDRLVGHMLDLSRIESGSLSAEKQWYDLGAVIDDAVGRLRPLLAAHPLTVDVPDDLPAVPLDYVQVSEVLTNLLENAVRHTPPGTPVTVAATRRPDEIMVRVSDAGPGIPVQSLARIFDKFYRAGDPPDKRRRTGSGLGLAVARGLVEAHGGRIWAESLPGQGASFIFTLPLDGVSTADGEEQAW